MSATPSSRGQITAPTTTNRPVGGRFLVALVQRDFAHMGACLEPEATMRALLPSGPVQFEGAPQVVDAFRFWFGDAEEFEVLDRTVSDVGDRLHLSWRLRVRPTPKGAHGWHIIEQQVYLRAGERIVALDLLCSGFMPAGER